MRNNRKHRGQTRVVVKTYAGGVNLVRWEEGESAGPVGRRCA